MIENIEKTEESKGMEITLEIKNYLLEISKWAKLLAIFGYVSAVLLGLFGILMFFVSSIFIDLPENANILGIGYFIGALICYFLVNFMYKFSTKIKQGLKFDNQEEVTLGFQNLKSYFKFVGILTVIIISIYALVFIAILIAVFSGLMITSF